MRKYLAYYENEWPANIAELTTIENKPFVGYLKDEGLMFTVIPKPVTGPADNEIWYTSSDGNVVTPDLPNSFGSNIVSNTYENGKGIITFAGPVTTIGNSTFYECSSLTSITIPNSVSSIESNAFFDCSSLTSVTIGNSVTSIEYYTFGNCSSLASIVVAEGNSIYDSRENCNAIIETGTNTLLLGCKNTIIPNGVVNIHGEAFMNTSCPISITIPESVTSIGSYAFGWTVLEHVEYKGTKALWQQIIKEDWCMGSRVTYVQCSDGQAEP